MNIVNETNTPQVQTLNKSQVDQLKAAQQEAFIDFCAVGGLVTNVDGSYTKVTAMEFANEIGVHYNTLTNWKKTINDFGNRVRERRFELMKIGRETSAWNRMYTIFMTSTDHKAAVDAGKVWLGHFGEMNLPVQRSDVKLSGSLAEMFSEAEAKYAQVMEGEVVDGNPGTAA